MAIASSEGNQVSNDEKITMDLGRIETTAENGTITESTITGNTAAGEGGGLWNSAMGVQAKTQEGASNAVPFHRVISNTIYGSSNTEINSVDEAFAEHGRDAQAAGDVLVLIGPNGELIYTSA